MFRIHHIYFYLDVNLLSVTVTNCVSVFFGILVTLFFNGYLFVVCLIIVFGLLFYDNDYSRSFVSLIDGLIIKYDFIVHSHCPFMSIKLFS